MLIARRLGLSRAAGRSSPGSRRRCLPLTQYLHGVGQIDHHFAEYIFVLATIACGLQLAVAPGRHARRASLLGIVLGMAPAIHNALFILQLPVLASLLALWAAGHPHADAHDAARSPPRCC